MDIPGQRSALDRSSPQRADQLASASARGRPPLSRLRRCSAAFNRLTRPPFGVRQDDRHCRADRLVHRRTHGAMSSTDSRLREHGPRARIGPACTPKPLRFTLSRKLTLWTTARSSHFVHNHLHDKNKRSTFHPCWQFANSLSQWQHPSKSNSTCELAPLVGIAGSRNYFCPSDNIAQQSKLSLELTTQGAF